MKRYGTELFDADSGRLRSKDEERALRAFGLSYGISFRRYMNTKLNRTIETARVLLERDRAAFFVRTDDQ